MTKTLLTAAALLFIAGCGSTITSSPNPTPRPEPTFAPGTVKRLNDAFSNWMKTSNAPGAVVGIWIPGKGSYVAVRGTSNVATGKPMHIVDHFRIGSNTKVFTATVLLELAGEKKVRLDDPVSKYANGVPNGKHITLRMLGNMTSGLFNYSEDETFVKELQSDPNRVWTPQQLLAVGFAHKPYFAPGTGFHYSNTNSVLLGLIIESVTHQPIETVFRERLFKPLGLQQTIWPHSGSMPEPYAHGITTQTPDGHEADATHWNPSWAFTAGKLISTLDDMHVWVKSYAGTLITPEMQKQRLTWVTLPPTTPKHTYGIGIGLYNGWIGHEGSLPGYNTGGYYLPSNKAVLVVLVNSDISTAAGTPSFTLFKALTKIIAPNNVPV